MKISAIIFKESLHTLSIRFSYEIVIYFLATGYWYIDFKYLPIYMYICDKNAVRSMLFWDCFTPLVSFLLSQEIQICRLQAAGAMVLGFSRQKHQGASTSLCRENDQGHFPRRRKSGVQTPPAGGNRVTLCWTASCMVGRWYWDARWSGTWSTWSHKLSSRFLGLLVYSRIRYSVSRSA